MQKKFTEILQSKKIESICETNLDNQLSLPQKFRIAYNNFEQFTQQTFEVYFLKIDEILSTNFPIVFFGSKGQGKTTLALKINELIEKSKQEKQIKPILISAQNIIQSDFNSILKQTYFQNNQKQMKKIEQDIQNDQIRVIIIIDDFDVILLEKQELLQNIQESIWKIKCKFIYFVNSFIRKHEVYHNWIRLESRVNQYEIMQFNKMDVKNYFEQYIPWEQCLSNIDLSQHTNNNLIQPIVARIQNNQNINNILLKIIKLSSIVDDMEQEAGNAMMLLKEFRKIVKNQDFSFIRMNNSSFDFVSFHKCNFEGSKMENVDISRCWFISCNLNYVQWLNMIKNEVQCDISIGNGKTVETIVFTNDDQFFAVGFDNLRIELWHIKTCKQIAVSRNDRTSNNYYCNIRMKFSSNRVLLASRSYRAQTKILNCQTNKLIWKINLKLSDQPITFSNNNQILALGLKKVIYLWDMKKGKNLFQFNEHTGEITELQFSNNDQLLASCCQRQVCIWNIKKKQQVLKQINQQYLTLNSFSPDLKYLASCDELNEIRVSNLISQVEIRKNWRNNQSNYDAKFTGILFSPTGKYIASGFYGGAVTLFSLIEKKTNYPKPTTRTQSNSECFDILTIKDWNQSKIFDSNEKGEIIYLKFSTNENYLISGNSEGTIKFHDFQDHTKVQQNYSKFDCLAFSHNGKILAFGSQENEKVFLWDMEQEKLLRELTSEASKKQFFRSIAFSFDDQLLAYCYDHKVALWNLKTRELIYEIKYEDYAEEAVFSPTELVLASCCKYSIFIWSIAIKKQVKVKQQKVISTHNRIHQIAYSPCGNLLAQAGGKNVCLWDIISQQACKIFEVNELKNYYQTIAFSPDGKVLVSGGEDGIIFWNIKQKNKILSIQEGTNYIKFSPNGQLLASAMEDSTIKIWDVSSFSVSKNPIVLTGHRQKVSQFDFSQDGTMLATNSFFEEQILIWDIQRENLDKVQILTRNQNLQTSYSITPLYAFPNDFSLNSSNSFLKDAQIVSNKGVNLIQLFLQMGGKR